MLHFVTCWDPYKRPLNRPKFSETVTVSALAGKLFGGPPFGRPAWRPHFWTAKINGLKYTGGQKTDNFKYIYYLKKKLMAARQKVGQFFDRPVQYCTNLFKSLALRKSAIYRKIHTIKKYLIKLCNKLQRFCRAWNSFKSLLLYLLVTLKRQIGGLVKFSFSWKLRNLKEMEKYLGSMSPIFANQQKFHRVLPIPSIN
ncbi:hypothetical protein BpHYR1_003473 [Brachionus plicatilis]|uniref:Uncharacterized protein n=1 Tax=Brachionus plicatilis TaxID=10195 RepID=A0A3M7T0V3_BRAPC|nr:hypothetical protein BpHYR1_003473 [Brachionus plicatilis]